MGKIMEKLQKWFIWTFIAEMIIAVLMDLINRVTFDSVHWLFWLFLLMLYGALGWACRCLAYILIYSVYGFLVYVFYLAISYGMDEITFLYRKWKRKRKC